MRIAVDVMGADHGPEEIVRGALQAGEELGCEIVLVGDEVVIADILKKNGVADNKKVSVVHASQVIEMHEHPAAAVRTKKDASVVVASRLLREKMCDALVAPGNTGAAASAALLVVGRIKGVERPAIATDIPSMKGETIVLDSGANVDCKPKNMVQSAIMGSVYAERIFAVENPKVGLLNIGEEESKGNEQTKEAYPMLKASQGINFIGNVEGRDIPKGNVDVVVCDGFVGNIVLKFGEGLAKAIMTVIKEAVVGGGLLTKLGGFLIRPALQGLKKRLDPSEHGGALLLGIKAPFVICHGSSNDRAIANAVRLAAKLVRNDVVSVIAERIRAAEERNEE